MSWHVVSPGLQSLLVDAGRLRSRSLGLPVGGAADRLAWSVGNALVGNDASAVALEVCLAGPTLRTDADTALVVFGAPFEIEIDGRAISANRTIPVPAGATMKIGPARVGMRAYVCVPGGFSSPEVLGSCSGLQPLKTGDELACRPSRLPIRGLPDELLTRWCRPSDVAELRCVVGGQAEWFDRDEFAERTWTVQPASNRMGLRLDGDPLRRPSREMVSEPVAPGAVQVTNDGRCVVLGIDGQTIGGYPKIAQVARVDLDLLGRLRPGERVRFRWLTVEEAEAASRAEAAFWREWLVRLRVAAGDP